ncbi:ABC transporter permease [Vagococcus sp. BWB3-3]|uniref:ABC transporter permease n=1 Tax=Vagococcus allomyrinae TaxID=2794353 RepID=A0A940SUF8_9ENTE|nr:ABC transporter permease [Vagococcus allomyrinae]MBP1040739.1 ABC transporter permease [Vagococcus allomyrinae]
MMFKLSLTSVKKRWQDYLVLMLGLMIAISIFYMFQTLSLNTSFLEENIPSVSMVAIVFQLGAFLLSIITIVYIFYANSFLLSMRKKEYGMYMMLGAKKKKIGQMMAIETLFIGSFSIVVGLLLGTVLAKLMGDWLSSAIDLPSNTYEAFVPNALLITLVFFCILFVITTIVNVTKFMKTRTLDLLYSESQSERSKGKPLMTIVKICLSLVLIGIGYACMVNIMTVQIIGIVVAILTITPGTFLFFSALVPLIVGKLKSWEALSGKKIRIFTLSQLSFKASSLAQVLGLVTMLLALSLGAVTVGQAFKNFAADLLSTNVNDAVVYNATPEIQAVMDKLETKEAFTYHSKKVGETAYFIQEELANHPLLVQEKQEIGAPFKELKEVELNHVYAYQNEGEGRIAQGFNQIADGYNNSGLYENSYAVVSQAEFDQLVGEVNTIQVIRVADYQAQLANFKELHQLELARHPGLEYSNGKYEMYQQIQSMANGFMFMGFFLGIAFLAMLASCLMFKILTGAYQDIARYDMLHKIGVRRQLLMGSIRKEILAIFLAPAFLGVIHVLVGLKMFTLFIPNPYAYIAMPFGIYGCIYLVYYFITVYLYKDIVLPKK